MSERTESERRLYAIDNGRAQSHPSPAYIGMTKREHFAALAMQGIIAQWSSVDDRAAANAGRKTRMQYAAESAVESADALLLALETVKP